MSRWMVLSLTSHSSARLTQFGYARSLILRSMNNSRLYWGLNFCTVKHLSYTYTWKKQCVLQEQNIFLRFFLPRTLYVPPPLIYFTRNDEIGGYLWQQEGMFTTEARRCGSREEMSLLEFVPGNIKPVRIQAMSFPLRQAGGSLPSPKKDALSKFWAAYCCL